MPEDRSNVPAADSRIVIEGAGLVTPLGDGLWETVSALLAGRTLVDRLRSHETPLHGVELAQMLGHVHTVQHTATDPVIELAEQAGREAVTAAGVSAQGLPCWIGTSKGAMHAWSAEAVFGPLPGGGGFRPTPPGIFRPRDAGLPTALGPHGYMGHHLMARLGVVVRSTVVAACASGLVALHQARAALRHGRVRGDRALVLAGEGALLPLLVASYKRLGVLADLTAEGYRCRPLDVRRRGFMLVQVGAAVVLRRLAPGEAPGPGQVELVDTAAATDTHDLVRSAPGMPALDHVAERLLRGRGPVDVLHPHAPGTPEHDAEEVATLARHVEGRPQVYASKGALGHGLGAAGLVNVALACAMIRSRRVPPMPWLEQPEACALPLDAGPGALPAGSRHALFAAGFGGHAAGAVVGGA